MANLPTSDNAIVSPNQCLVKIGKFLNQLLSSLIFKKVSSHFSKLSERKCIQESKNNVYLDQIQDQIEADEHLRVNVSLEDKYKTRPKPKIKSHSHPLQCHL